jgi:hypothetical protein
MLTGNRDAVMSTALAMHCKVRQAHLLERFFWEFSVLALNLLKADHVRVFVCNESFDIWETEPDRIDVPADDL